MAGNDVCRLQGLEVLPAFQPTGRVGVVEDRQQAFVKGHVAGDHEALLGQPDDDIARRVGGTEVPDLDAEAAHLNQLFVLEGLAWSLQDGARRLVLVVGLHLLEDLRAAILELRRGIGMSDDRNALLDPIAVAEHGVALAVLVDHQLHGFVGDLLDLLVQGLGKLIAAAAVDDDDALPGDDEGEVVVVARVVVARRCRGPDRRPDVGNHFHRFAVEDGLRILIGNLLAGEAGRSHRKHQHHHGQQATHIKSFQVFPGIAEPSIGALPSPPHGQAATAPGARQRSRPARLRRPKDRRHRRCA